MSFEYSSKKTEDHYTDKQFIDAWAKYKSHYTSVIDLLESTQTDEEFIELFKKYGITEKSKTISDTDMIAYALKFINSDFKEWVKKVDIKDKKLADSLWYFEKVGVLEKKKEKNRVFFKRTSLLIKDILKSEYHKLEWYEEWDKRIVRRLLDIYFDEDEEFVKIYPSSHCDSISIFMGDFFGIEGIYPKELTPLLPTKDFGRRSYQRGYPNIKHVKYTSADYDKAIREHNIITLKDIIS